MDPAVRYANAYLLAHPAVVVLRAPTGYLKTSAARIAANAVRSSTIVDCRDISSPGDLVAALGMRETGAPSAGAVTDLIVFDNASSALGNAPLVATIHDVLRRRTPRQTIAICTRARFPLPAEVLPSSLELTHEDLAIDVARELADRGLAPERIREIQRLTLGWPMPAYRLATIATATPDDVPLLRSGSRALERLLQDVRLDYLDRLPRARRDDLAAMHRRDRGALITCGEESSSLDAFHAMIARADGLLLRDGPTYRIPAIIVAALDAAVRPVVMSAPAQRGAEPALVFDVVAGEITAGGLPIRLPRREFELFANLAIKRRPVASDVLLEEVWGDGDADGARLKVTVGRLRKRLGFATIRCIAGGYAIGENVGCTLTELEDLMPVDEPLAPATAAALEAIVARHRRGAAGTTLSWPWYAPWCGKIDAFIERACVALGRHALAHDRFAVARDRANEAIAVNALSQGGHELAVRALIGQGNVVGARQMISTYSGDLRRSLGIALPESLARLVGEVAS